jgi:carbamoyl-phosphate synthase small subunit
MVDPVTINSEIIVTHKSLFDNSIQGIKHKTKPFFGFQGHPEASPGPQDIESLFDNFIAMIKSC